MPGAGPPPEARLLRVEEVPLGEVYFDDEVYPRVEVEGELVAQYAELLREGAELPPVRVVERPSPRGRYLCLDGRHRVEAARRAGLERVRAEVYEIPDRWLLYYAARWNSTHGKRLTRRDARKAAERMYRLGYGVGQIAEALGYSRRHVRRLLRGIRREERERVAELYRQGVPPREIAERLGLSVDVVTGYLKQLSTLDIMSRVDKERRARELRERGKSLREIAEELGVSRETVRKWLRAEGREEPAEEEAGALTETAVGESPKAKRAAEEAPGEVRGEGEELLAKLEYLEGRVGELEGENERLREENRRLRDLLAGLEAELSRLREESRALRGDLDVLRREVRRLLAERAGLRNRLAHYRSQARARARVGGRELEYDPLSLAPYDPGDGMLLCPLCGLEFRVASVNDYLGHLRWHRLSDRAIAAVREALRGLYGRARGE